MTMTTFNVSRDLDVALARAVDNTVARLFQADALGNRELAEFFAGVLCHMVGSSNARRLLGRSASRLLG